MSAEFSPPPVTELQDLTAFDHIRNVSLNLREKAGRIAAATLLTLGGAISAFAVEETINPAPAAAYSETTGDYPWADATHVPQPPAPDSITWGYINKSTCDNRTSYTCRTKIFGDYNVYDPWGYYLRNCTSYVAWRTNVEFGANTADMGNGAGWAASAPNKGWSVDHAPEVGDIAQWNGALGHVALVEEVGIGSNTGKVRVAEYNQGFDGIFKHDRWTVADNYIDINGPNPPGFRLKIGTASGAGGLSPNDLIWQQNNTIFKLDGDDNFNTTSYTGGIATPDWAGTMDYNKDGRDDVVMYRKSDGTIRVVTNNPSGGWTSHADNPVRGPGFGEPAWAKVGDLDGDGDKDDIAWWTAGGNVHKLTGPNFTTSSYAEGIQPPDWADMMDYNGDGRDDIVLYRQGDGTIRVLLNSRSGGWTPHPDNPVRGPGVGRAVWAEVADLDGDGKAKEIAWWTPAGRLYKFHGPNFTTASYDQGMAPPDWAGIVDYDKDGRDDVVLYRQGDGTLRVVENSRSGGWTSHPNNPVRGPGIGAPDWAAVANLG